MAILTVRNVPDDVHRALRVRAAKHGRSTEAEVREIVNDSAQFAQDSPEPDPAELWTDVLVESR